jgi:hypothetical protein
MSNVVSRWCPRKENKFLFLDTGELGAHRAECRHGAGVSGGGDIAALGVQDHGAIEGMNEPDECVKRVVGWLGA